MPAALSEQFAAAHANARLEVIDSGDDLLAALDYMGPRVADFLLGR